MVAQVSDLCLLAQVRDPGHLTAKDLAARASVC